SVWMSTLPRPGARGDSLHRRPSAALLQRGNAPGSLPLCSIAGTSAALLCTQRLQRCNDQPLPGPKSRGQAGEQAKAGFVPLPGLGARDKERANQANKRALSFTATVAVAVRSMGDLPTTLGHWPNWTYSSMATMADFCTWT